jgi:hypothetical protein
LSGDQALDWKEVAYFGLGPYIALANMARATIRELHVTSNPDERVERSNEPLNRYLELLPILYRSGLTLAPSPAVAPPRPFGLNRTADGRRDPTPIMSFRWKPHFFVGCLSP